MSSETNWRKPQAGSIDPLGLLKEQKRIIIDNMNSLIMKCYVPSVLSIDSQAISYKWTSDKARDTFNRMQSLLFLVNEQITKGENELQRTS